MNYRTAFASIDGFQVDQHFASARCFQVYDISAGSYSHIETRKTPVKQQCGCGDGFDHLLEILNDCDAVFVSKIGQSAAAFMIGRGKRVFEADGTVKEIIDKLIEDNLLKNT